MAAFTTWIVLVLVMLLMLDAFLFQIYGYEYFAKHGHVSYSPGVGVYMMWKIEGEG